VRFNDLSDFSTDIYKWKAKLRNCLGKVLNITMAVSKESNVNHAHALKEYWTLWVWLYPRRKDLITLNELDAG
jgi:hypothetical protein